MLYYHRYRNLLNFQVDRPRVCLEEPKRLTYKYKRRPRRRQQLCLYNNALCIFGWWVVINGSTKNATTR